MSDSKPIDLSPSLGVFEWHNRLGKITHKDRWVRFIINQPYSLLLVQELALMDVSEMVFGDYRL